MLALRVSAALPKRLPRQLPGLLRPLSTGPSSDAASTSGHADPSVSEAVKPKKELMGMKLARKLGWDPESITTDNFNRYWLLPAGMLNHLCLGSVFAWSIFNHDLTRLSGVVAQAPADWSLGDVSLTFSLIMAGFGWGALLGKHLDAWGPRVSCTLGAMCLGSGFGLAALATKVGSLPLLYLGGTVWGFANGFAYVPPVAALLKWFPDRKGLGGGATIFGFGGGAMVATPLFNNLVSHFRVLPEYVGPSQDVELQNESGTLLAQVGEEWREVVVASATDASVLGLNEGVYLIGTGSTGISETFLAMGVGYSAIMAMSAVVYRLPRPGYVPGDSTPPAAPSTVDEEAPKATPNLLTKFNVDVEVASRSKQFWLMWTGFGFSIAGAYGILSTGKTLLIESFQVTNPDLITAGFAASFVAMMSVANLGGRVFWSSASDYFAYRLGDPFLGRKLAYTLMWGMTPPLYAAIVWSVHQCAVEPGVLPVAVFSGSVFGIMSSFGGSAATRPAITGDLFGTDNVGVLTARQLSVVLPSAYAGPKIATSLRESSIEEAVRDLSSKVSPADFLEAFGVPQSQLDSLLEAKAINISRLMELVPPGTVDPTPFVYDNVMYTMVGINLIAVVCNLATYPVDPQYHAKPAAKDVE